MLGNRFAMALFFLLFLGAFAGFVFSTPPEQPPESIIAGKIVSSLNSLGTPEMTGFFIFRKDYHYLDASAIAGYSGSIASSQVCLSAGNVNDGSFVLGENGQALQYKGQEDVKLKAEVLCDVEQNLLPDLEKRYDSVMVPKNFSHCGIGSSSQTICLVALSSEGLEVNPFSRPPVDVGAGFNLVIGFFVLAAGIVSFAGTILLTLFLLLKSEDKKVKLVFAVKTVLYAVPMLLLSAYMFRFSWFYSIPYQFILVQPLVYLAELVATFFAYWLSRESKRNLKLVLLLLFLDIMALVFAGLIISWLFTGAVHVS